MSRNYKFRNPKALYFVSFAVINWLDVFTENLYKDILLDSLRYSQEKKGMEIIAWCIMPDHVHLIFRSTGNIKPEQLLGDIKRFSSRKIVKAITENPNENRKDFLLDSFAKAAKQSSNVKHYQFWQHNNHPVELWSNKVIYQKIQYIHNNPVKAGLVLHPEDYPYSSAIDYTDRKGLLDNIVKFEYYG